MSAAAGDAPDLERRFGGLVRLYGAAGATRIVAAHVAVVGIGGVGSWAAEALARSGVGQLTLIDMDHVAESNVNRQVHALTATLGQSKVAAMRGRIAQINPTCRVHAVDEFVEPGNWPQLLAHPADVVIDACDRLVAKQTMAAWALDAGMRLIAVGAAGGKRRAECVEISDIGRATHDPLIAQLRQRLRRQRGTPAAGQDFGLPCVFSRESVARPVAGSDGSLGCHGYGSSVAVTASFGLCAAGWALERLAGGQ